MFYLLLITLYIYMCVSLFSYITGDDNLIWSTGYKNYIIFITLKFNALIIDNNHPNNYIGNRILRNIFLN